MNRYQAYLAAPGEHTAVAELWREGMSDPKIQDVIDQRLAWFYDKNPLGPAKTWLVKDTQLGEVIGCASVYPRRLRVGDQVVTAGVMADFLVSKKHRIAGPALQLQRTLAEQSAEAGFAFIYGYPNQQAWPIFKRIGYQAVARSSLWVKPLRSGYKLGELADSSLTPYLGPKLREKLIPPAAKLGSLIGDRVLRANDLRLSFGLSRGSHSDLGDRADQRFDQLEFAGSGLCDVSGARDAAYLNWRYADHPTQQHRFFSLTDAAGALQGLVVYRLEQDKAFLLDAVWQGPPAAAEALLLSFAGRMREEGAVSLCVAYAGASSVVEMLPKLLFFKRDGERNLIVYVPPGQRDDLRARVLSEQSWAMFDGELDI